MSKSKQVRALCVLMVCAVLGCERQQEEPPRARAPEIARLRSKVETLPVYEDAAFTPRWIDAAELDAADVHTIPEFEFTNQLGQTVSHETFDEKIYITDFFFTTCPGICLDMTVNMAKLQREFEHDDDVLFLSHTVTPDVDTPEVLARYAKKHGVRSGKWHLVTGDRARIYDLGRRHYFVEEDLGVDKPDDEFLHTENFLIIDGRRRIRGIYNGLKDASLAQLVADVRTLQREEPSRPGPPPSQ